MPLFWTVTLNDTVLITFQIDTGSSANILPLQDYIRATNDVNRASIVPKDITLVMHDHSKRKALGSARLKVEHNGNKHELNFVIVNQKVTPLLGLKSCQGMGLVKIMVPGVHAPVNNVAATPEKAVSESIISDPVLSPFADVFHGIGCLPGEYSISLDRNVSPVVHPPRRVPVPETRLLIGCGQKCEILRHFQEKLCGKKGLLCGKLCDFFKADLTLFF